MQFWMDSINGEETLSGGPLSPLLERPWDLIQSEPDKELQASLYATVTSSGDRSPALWLLQTVGDYDEIKMRALGCTLLMGMPKDGLLEAVTALVDMRAYYLEILTPEGPGLVGPPVVGKVTAAVPRPDLVLSDDE